MDDSIFELSASWWCLAFVCALVVGMSKCGLAGLGTVAVPLMAMVLPAKASTGVMLPVLIIGDAMGVAHFNRHANWKLLMKLMPPALAGIVIGFWLMKQPWLDDRIIRKSIGVIVLILCFITMLRSKYNFSFGESNGTDFTTVSVAIVFGIIAGVTTMVANAAGPITMIYLLAMKLPKDEFIGTSAWYFIVLNWIKVPFMINLGLINPESLCFDFKLAPAILVGGILGIILTGYLSEKSYKIWVQVLTILAALKLLF